MPGVHLSEGKSGSDLDVPLYPQAPSHLPPRHHLSLCLRLSLQLLSASFSTHVQGSLQSGHLLWCPPVTFRGNLKCLAQAARLASLCRTLGHSAPGRPRLRAFPPLGPWCPLCLALQLRFCWLTCTCPPSPGPSLHISPSPRASSSFGLICKETIPTLRSGRSLLYPLLAPTLDRVQGTVAKVCLGLPKASSVRKGRRLPCLPQPPGAGPWQAALRPLGPREWGLSLHSAGPLGSLTPLPGPPPMQVNGSPSELEKPVRPTGVSQRTCS